jgi:predicted nucleic acid-binding protein
VTDLALDTSVAIPFLTRSHAAHEVVQNRLARRRPALTGHSLAETYAVLTRLPGDARVAPSDAVVLIEAKLEPPVLLDAETAASLPSVLASVGIAGGAVHDALVALAAREADLPLATRDLRAASTYAALNVRVELVSG